MTIEAVRWRDVRRLGISRNHWLAARRELRALPGRARVYRAREVARTLGLADDVFENGWRRQALAEVNKGRNER